MTEIKDGGPAFPVEVDSAQPDGRQTGNTVWQAYGLSMRDYFAAKAMQGTLADHTVGQGGGSWENFCNSIATESYEIADAMLRAREANHG